MFVVLCMITCFIPFPSSSQKLQFVGEWCIFVSMCTSCLSLQTITVKSSLYQTQYCLVSVNCPMAVKSCGIPILLVYEPTTTDFSLCWIQTSQVMYNVHMHVLKLLIPCILVRNIEDDSFIRLSSQYMCYVTFRSERTIISATFGKLQRRCPPV